MDVFLYVCTMRRDDFHSDFGSKIFLTEKVKELDRITLLTQNITESELITRAAFSFFEALHKRYPPSRDIFIFCGPGNNGNDGRALVPLLADAGYRVTCYHLGCDDAKPLPTFSDRPLAFHQKPLLIDALFGAGLNRPIEGVAATWVRWMNSVQGVRIALDIPSGWHGEENNIVSKNPLNIEDVECDELAIQAIVRAHLTLTLEFPKLSFFFPESACYVGEWQVVPLGLSTEAMDSIETPYKMISPKWLRTLYHPLPKFLHKGSAGRVRLFAGSPGMMGAAALAVKAAYRTGAGWVEVRTPKSEMQLMQTMVPEAIVRDVNDMAMYESEKEDSFSASGAGPGLGISELTTTRFRDFLRIQTKPLVLDADALNILSAFPDFWQDVPSLSIITPHPGEFKRLSGAWKNDYQRLQLQRYFAAHHKVIVVLKGAHTSIALPNGEVFFNVSGNPGMATAGSGDVLTGILLSLIAQGFSPHESAILGVYLHGMAGDMAAKSFGQRSVMATDMVNNIHKAILSILEIGEQLS